LSTNEPIGPNIDNDVEHSKNVGHLVSHIALKVKYLVNKFVKQKAPILYFYKIEALTCVEVINLTVT